MKPERLIYFVGSLGFGALVLYWLLFKSGMTGLALFLVVIVTVWASYGGAKYSMKA